MENVFHRRYFIGSTFFQGTTLHFSCSPSHVITLLYRFIPTSLILVDFFPSNSLSNPWCNNRNLELSSTMGCYLTRTEYCAVIPIFFIQLIYADYFNICLCENSLRLRRAYLYWADTIYVYSQNSNEKQVNYSVLLMCIIAK